MARAPAHLLPVVFVGASLRSAVGLGWLRCVLRLGHLRWPGVLALAGGWLIAVSAHAASFDALILDKSSVRFEYKALNVPMEGRFKAFDARLKIDTDRLEQAEGSLSIDLSSVDTGWRPINQELMSKAWFDVASHPRASFVLQGVRSTGSRQYEALGQLEIKGQVREVRAPIRLAAPDIFAGSFAFKRSDYGIGQGWWSRFDFVADEIVVHFSFSLR